MLEVRVIPIVLISGCNALELCRHLLNELFHCYDVQATGLTLLDCEYDIRLRRMQNISSLKHDLDFMKRRYKTDLIFIAAGPDQLNDIRTVEEIDVEISAAQDTADLIHEGGCIKADMQELPGTLYKLLTD